MLFFHFWTEDNFDLIRIAYEMRIYTMLHILLEYFDLYLFSSFTG